MQLYNSLTKQLEEVETHNGKVRIYSCGPTVYERAHIGNLSSFIYADTLRRALEASGHQVEHVMNITDVDDKTIKSSREQNPNLEPMEALQKLTRHYESLFREDLQAVGVDVDKIKFVRATENIEAMQKLIKELLDAGVAYEAEDGIYFSINEYRKRGKKYGQLVEIDSESTAQSRINNDEYDKDNPQDFVLWKAQKPGEPTWNFEINGKNIAGRPGWHIECSAMSTKYLGKPFEIHTGGVDLKFPHHENEIAQSTAINGDLLSKIFFHSEHMLINNQKMSKSLNNFLTLEDVKEHGFDPLVFRLLVLQSHYRNQAHFSWENLQAAQNRLADLRAWADTLFQTETIRQIMSASSENYAGSVGPDLMMSGVLIHIEANSDKAPAPELLEKVDNLLGLKLAKRSDVSNDQKSLITEREDARKNLGWAKSDEIRKQLEEQGIGINDTPNGPVWYRL